MVVVETPSEGKPSMGKSIQKLSSVARVGLDLAKKVFQIHAVDAKARSWWCASSRAAGSPRFLRASAMCGGPITSSTGGATAARRRFILPPAACLNRSAYPQMGIAVRPGGHPRVRTRIEEVDSIEVICATAPRGLPDPGDLLLSRSRENS